MGNDLISRSKLLISILAMIEHNNEIVTQDKVLGWAQGVDNCRELIENAPTVNRLTTNLFIVGNGDVITTCGEVVGHVDLEKIG